MKFLYNYIMFKFVIFIRYKILKPFLKFNFKNKNILAGKPSSVNDEIKAFRLKFFHLWNIVLNTVPLIHKL